MTQFALRIAYSVAVASIGISSALAQTPQLDPNNALIAICDRTAASSFDQKRPAGIPGLDTDKIDATIAIPACEAAAQAHPKDARTAFQLGRAYWAGKRFDAARIQYEKADAASYGLATNNLAVLFIEGNAFPKDTSRYRKLLTRAAELGVALSQYNIGLNYLNGSEDFEKNPVEARTWLKRAVDANYLPALPEFALMLRDGEGGSKDLDEAKRLFLNAAKQGNVFSQHNYALMLEKEDSPSNRAESKYWYRQAALGGNKYAMNKLGYYCEMGWGGSVDLPEARLWYKKAAEAGNEVAMSNYGTMLRLGRGGPRDAFEARHWYVKASDAGVTEASNNLGTMYQSGQGGLKDIGEARRLYEKAVSQGKNDVAKSNIARIDAWYAAKRQHAQRQQRYVYRRGSGYRYSGGGGGSSYSNSYQPPSMQSWNPAAPGYMPPHKSTGLCPPGTGLGSGQFCN